MSRTKLASRRFNRFVTIQWRNLSKPILVCAGFDSEGKVREIFGDGLMAGSDAAVQLNDECVLVSILLQHGYSLEDLIGRLTRVDNGLEGAAETGAIMPSMISLVLKAAAELERELAAELRAIATPAAE